MDGVLIDSIEISYGLQKETLPQLTREEYSDLLMGNFHDKKAEYVKTNPQIVLTEEEKEQHKVYYADEKSKSPIFQGIYELLNFLKSQGFILTINTSAYERNTTPLLTKNNIINFFDYVATFEDSKSKVEKFKIIQDKYDCEIGDMIFVTDSVGDLREGENFGMKMIGVTWGVHSREYFEQENSLGLIGIANSVPRLQDMIVRYFE